MARAERRMASRERDRPHEGVRGKEAKSADPRRNPKRFAGFRSYRHKKTPTETGWGSIIGGAKGDRTPDLRIANAALSQLSYCPENI